MNKTDELIERLREIVRKSNLDAQDSQTLLDVADELKRLDKMAYLRIPFLRRTKFLQRFSNG